MENTSPFLFDNIDEKFFLAVRGRAVGPLTAQEVYERIQKAEIGLLNYIWREGWPDWKKVCEEREFAVLVPQKPTHESIQAIREKLGKKKAPTSPTGDANKDLYLYFNRTQYGPFSKPELIHVLQSHKLTRAAYVWTPGWPNWKQMAELPEYSSYFAPPAPTTDPTIEPSASGIWKKPRSSKTKESVKDKETTGKTIGAKLSPEAGVDATDRRRAPRRPLVARLFLHNDKDVIIAVCRDISVGGMQVLTDRAPGPVGAVIRLNVSPGDPKKVKGFVAEGEIVRLLEDGRGFSFRFKKISDEARKAIENYIKTDF